MSGDISHCHSWEGAIGIQWAEAEDAFKIKVLGWVGQHPPENQRRGCETVLEENQTKQWQGKILGFTMAVGYYLTCQIYNLYQIFEVTEDTQMDRRGNRRDLGDSSQLNEVCASGGQ